MTIGTGFAILVEERVTVELEGGERSFVPEYTLPTHQPRILYILSIHVNNSSKLGPGLRDARTPGSSNHPFPSPAQFPASCNG